MKALILLLMPMVLFSAQPRDTIVEDAKKLAQEVVSTRKKVDSLIELKNIEVQKQLKLISKIKAKILKIQAEQKVKTSPSQSQKSNGQNRAAVKEKEYVTYKENPKYGIEYVPKKWLGRVFSKGKYREKHYIIRGNDTIYIKLEK